MAYFIYSYKYDALHPTSKQPANNLEFQCFSSILQKKNVVGLDKKRKSAPSSSFSVLGRPKTCGN